ncbi:uncharacterized protein LOC131254132 [Magnolia sinica]|uniref:uncharacterized protein LOC131254132 n=1 Tax=Magnolia sinica TaxID=86752 RepID=UPI002659A2E8|nr:uncharacterized protein LOC131254132 [Magnolia sinica]
MMCRAFFITLTGVARSWYQQLKPRSIGTFAELSRAFLTQFIVGKKSRKPSIHLLTLKQKSGESLKDYISRFNEEVLHVDDYSDKITLTAIISRLKDERFIFLIGKNPLTTLSELISLAQKYTNAKEFFSSRKNAHSSEQPSNDKKCKDAPSQPRMSRKKTDEESSHKHRPSRMPESQFNSYTPLNTSREQILLEIIDKRLLHCPCCMRTDASQQDKYKYCRFHRHHGHNTGDRIDLKEDIEALTCKGHLQQYVKEEKQPRKEESLAHVADNTIEI